MGTRMYGCGCSVSWSMFGDREVMSVRVCTKHMHQVCKNSTEGDLDSIARAIATVAGGADAQEQDTQA